jgi:glucoside 3-dehydrogenase (cytochrome c) hitch-hiker subunit
MNRRDALRLLATGVALQLAQGNVFAVLREARAVLGTQTSVRTLDPQQYATVTAITELIIPKTETPGATDVRVAEFIDLIVTEWYNPEERTRFLNGLADVDSRTQALFGKNFVDSSPPQQADILTVLGQQMIEEADALQDHARQYRGSQPEPNQNFYYMLRGLTLMGYYTSEAGATRELDFQIIPGRYDGCADGRAGKEEREN